MNPTTKALTSILILPLLAGVSGDQSMTNEKQEGPESSSAESILVVRRFNEAFNRHDVDAVMALMTDDVIFENTNPPPDGTRYSGKDAVRAFWTRFFDANPTAHFQEEEIIGGGDRVVVRWVYSKQKDGKPWHLRGADIFTVRDGKIAEKLSYVKG